ncbi:hypothetical protein BW247_00425 [Acidihalobacter ferrooxydans]|uniref:Uncharacterized protein n=2 Tax=Acidihalobacter ferrooxydans TaxID=1765967 RepID=A0A1P8UKV4_9GAMM|nr:hypothetical protein BW247_00425 [Acidihalobacter ferrooxydans]
MDIDERRTELRIDPGLEPATPLWQRVPTRTPEGQLASDFMMLIPGLRRRPRNQLQQVLDDIQAVLAHYRSVVLFADMNLKLNVLWISVRPVPGITLELAAAVKVRVPEAMLVSSKVRPNRR